MSKISFSAWKKYLTCPEMYRLHYGERLRPSGTSSALVFGTAVDEGLNALLLGDDKYMEVFRDHFRYEDFSNVQWDKRDIDMRVFDEEQAQKLQGMPMEYISWASLRVKGRLGLEEYARDILPTIKKVISIQKEIEGRPGVLDAILDFGDGPVLVDHKTAARPYVRTAVQDSTQLALYCSHEKIKKAGFIILVKKNCRKMLQVLIDDMPEYHSNLVVESMTKVEENISSGKYYKNLEACGKIYGKPCPYIKFCWKNDKNGLIKKETR